MRLFRVCYLIEQVMSSAQDGLNAGARYKDFLMKCNITVKFENVPSPKSGTFFKSILPLNILHIGNDKINIHKSSKTVMAKDNRSRNSYR